MLLFIQKINGETTIVRRIISLIRKAVEDYNMISEGDKVAVGVSGGKDSLILLRCLSDLST